MVAFGMTLGIDLYNIYVFFVMEKLNDPDELNLYWIDKYVINASLLLGIWINQLLYVDSE